MSKVRRIYKKYFDYTTAGWAIVLAGLTLSVVGLMMLRELSMGSGPASEVAKNCLVKQGRFLVVSVVAMVIIARMNYRKIGRMAYPLFVVTLLLLVLVLLGRYVPPLRGIFPRRNYSYRWINLYVLSVQPSEFLKITYVLALAWYLRYRHNYRRFRGLVGPFAFTIVPMILILLEPDLGTVMLLLPVLFMMLFAAGAKIKHLVLIVVMMIVVSPVLFSPGVMHRYQRSRIFGMLLQWSEVRNKLKQWPEVKKFVYSGQSLDNWHRSRQGYQLYHSKTAIGSGGGFGFVRSGRSIGQTDASQDEMSVDQTVIPEQGPYTDGTRPLPEAQNDFIYAIICHEYGFVGAVIPIALYIIMITGLVEISTVVTEPFGRLTAVGVMAMILTQCTINMAMTMGLMPITGVTLPFVSYGGSSLLTYFILIAVVIAVDRARPINMGPRPFEFRDDD